MLLSKNWLEENLKNKLPSSEKLEEILTAHTAETEGHEETKKRYENVFVGELKSVEKFSEKLHKGVFDLGHLGDKQIVFGSVHPLVVGQKYPVAVAGAKLKSGINIAESEIKGVKSEGMVADNAELGMKNPGLLDLSEVEIGTEISSLNAANDVIIDIDNKSLTHRPDLMGHTGFLRELAITTENEITQEIKKPNFTPHKIVDVEIQTKNCRRFIACEVQNVEVKPSPLEILFKLEHAGTRSISNIVDITNLTLLGFGQPMHAFDADKINGKIIIRQAKKGEKLIALDEIEYELSEEDVVIADESGALSIAGVMGGLASAVTEQTTRVIFECASFDPLAVRKTSQRLGLRSESSMRYEKNLCPEQCEKALWYALNQLKEICPEAKIVGTKDVFSRPTEIPKIELNLEKLQKITGLKVEKNEVKEILTKLGFEVKDSGKPKCLSVKPPANRATKDITIEEDLIEEIVRIKGFDKIPSILPDFSAKPFPANKSRRTEHKVRFILKEMGMSEIMTHSLTDKGDVKIENPLSQNFTHLRSNLVEPALKEMESPLRTHKNLSFYELGRTYELPLGQEQNKVMLMMGSTDKTKEILVETLKIKLMKLGNSFNLSFEFEEAEKVPEFCHPFISGKILRDNKKVGGFGAISPSASPIKKGNIVWAELETATFEKGVETKYSPPKNEVKITRDISIFLSKEQSWSDIKRNLRTNDHIEKVELKDIFTDAKFVPEGQKNVILQLTLKPQKNPLDESQTRGIMEAIYQLLREKLDAEIR